MVTGAGVPVLVGKRTVSVPLEGLPLLSVVHVMQADCLWRLGHLWAVSAVVLVAVAVLFFQLEGQSLLSDYSEELPLLFYS